MSLSLLLSWASLPRPLLGLVFACLSPSKYVNLHSVRLSWRGVRVAWQRLEIPSLATLRHVAQASALQSVLFVDLSRKQWTRAVGVLEKCPRLRDVRWRPFSVEAASLLYSADLAPGATVVWFLGREFRAIQDVAMMRNQRFGGLYFDNLLEELLPSVLSVYLNDYPATEQFLSVTGVKLEGVRVPPLTWLRLKKVPSASAVASHAHIGLLQTLELHDCPSAAWLLSELKGKCVSLRTLELTGILSDVTVEHVLGLGCVGLQKLAILAPHATVRVSSFQLTSRLFASLPELEGVEVDGQAGDGSDGEPCLDLRAHKTLRMLEVHCVRSRASVTFLVSPLCVCVVKSPR
jgi:hypothetical protein